MNKKIFIKILLIILIVIIGIVSYFILLKPFFLSSPNNQQNTQIASPTIIETTSWNEYTDYKYNFKIKYPQDWELSKYTDGYNNEGPYVIVFATGKTSTEKYPFISIKENWSLNEEMGAIGNTDFQSTKIKNINNINIGSIPAKQIVYSTDIGLDFQKTIITQNQTLFMFNSYPNDDDFNKIISTIKFID